MTLRPDSVAAIRDLVRDLVRGDYDTIVRTGRAGRLDAEMMARAIADYPCTLVEPPELGLDDLDVCEIDGRPTEFAVDCDLWTLEEGRSDLTLQVSIDEATTPASIALEDLHVL